MRDEQGQSPTSNIVAFPLRGKFSEQAQKPSNSDIPLHVFLNDSLEKDALYVLQDFDAQMNVFLQGVNSVLSLQKQRGEAVSGDIVLQTELTFTRPFGIEVWEAMVIPYVDELKKTNPARCHRYLEAAAKTKDPGAAILEIAGMGLIAANAGYRQMLTRLKEALPAVTIRPHIIIENISDGAVISPSIMIGPTLGRPRDVREDIRAYVEGKNHLRPVPTL